MSIDYSENDKQITLSVAGKFHAISLAKEFAKMNALQGIYCVSRDLKSPNGLPGKFYHNRWDLAWWQALSGKVPNTGFSFKKKGKIFDEWMIRNVKKTKPGILHGWNGCSLETFKVAKTAGWETCVERSCPHNQFQYDILCEEAETIGLKHNQDMDELKRAIEELYLVDKIIAPSDYSARSYQDPELIKKVRRVSLGGNYTYRERSPKLNKGLKILMVGNQFLRKGTHYLIEAMKFIEDPNAELWIRGEVPGEYRGRIKDPRIKIIPSVPLAQLNELYASADVFVQPSVDEGFGMTVLEALSYGLPLVVTEHVGASDILSNKVASVVPIRNPEALAKAIMQVPNLVGDAFDAERLLILNENTWKNCASNLINLAYAD